MLRSRLSELREKRNSTSTPTRNAAARIKRSAVVNPIAVRCTDDGVESDDGSIQSIQEGSGTMECGAVD